MNLHILAMIYELKGLKKEALVIYDKIYKYDINNNQYQKHKQRLNNNNCFVLDDEPIANFFISAKSKTDMLELERWLIDG